MKKSFYYIASLSLILLLWSCSTKKNTKTSRFYHAFTSRYNIYFNGKTSFDESLKAMQEGYKESYSDLIYMFPVSVQTKDKQTPGGPFDRAIEKSTKAIKLHSIKKKPPKKPGWRSDSRQRAFQEQEEYNPFLKKCWLLMGQAQFYNADFLEASATFSYIVRHYAQDEEVVAEARLWQARCYSEMKWFYEAEDILSKLNINGIPQRNLNQYATVYADFLVKNKKYGDAVPYLEKAIQAEKNKRQRTRMKYLLGQMYAGLGQEGLAYEMYGQVIKSNPPYELEFAARIRQTEVFSGNSYQKVIKMLGQMAGSEKNKALLDQVYYALGNVYLNREDTVNAIENYRLAIEKSTQNGLDKAVCQIRLGDLYFSMRNYIKAQPCFSGALSGIQKEYREYDRVSKLSVVLDELVIHAEAVHLQDSLQAVAQMPEAERLALIDGLIEKVKKEEELAKNQSDKEAFLTDQESRGTGIERPGTETKGITLPVASTGEALFYFYNPQTVAQGKAQFQRKWGRRPLTDDWRRRKKALSTFDEDLNAAGVGADSLLITASDSSLIAGDSIEYSLDSIASDDPEKREFYLQQLPFTKEDVDASNLIIEDGLYNMAMIYKDKLEDLPLSISAFEDLEHRFPDNKHLMESYYQIYLMALRTTDTALAATYKNKLIRSFPDSDYAIAMANPNYEYNIRRMDFVQDSVYEATYNRYLAGDTITVRRNYRDVSSNYPLAKLIPKFMFLNALSYIQAGDANGFKNELKALVEKYPAADVSELAGEMLKGILRGRTLMQGSITGMNWNLRFGLGEDGVLSAADSARTFTPEPHTPYRMLFMYPAGSVDKNQLLFAVAAYNFTNFMVKEFDLTFDKAGPMHLMAIHGFVNFDEIVYYYKMIYNQDGYATSLDRGVIILPISDENYETLMHGKTLEEYIAFLEEHYGEVIPDLSNRLKARIAIVGDGLPDSEQVHVNMDIDSVQPEINNPATKLILSPDTVMPVLIPENKKELTWKEIEEIRKQEADEAAVRKAFEAQQKSDKELQLQKARENEDLLKEQQIRDEALLKAKVNQEKQLKLDRKARQKQIETDRKVRLKAREVLRKQKERDYKKSLKLKEQERKQKERVYKEKLKTREKTRRSHS